MYDMTHGQCRAFGRRGWIPGMMIINQSFATNLPSCSCLMERRNMEQLVSVMKTCIRLCFRAYFHPDFFLPDTGVGTHHTLQWTPCKVSKQPAETQRPFKPPSYFRVTKWVAGSQVITFPASLLMDLDLSTKAGSQENWPSYFMSAVLFALEAVG